MAEKKNAPAGEQADGNIGVATLYGIVFCSGAALMGLEMSGARMVEPHFGSTIYVWGSIIGVFMAALSIGYWSGGRVADRAPRIEALGAILLAAALLTLAIPFATPHFTTWINGFEQIEVRYRTLMASLVLFAPASICMGMVSPFAVRLAARQVSGLGRVAGSLYAVSTFGSIAGTFLVTFVLVEYIGSSAIVYSMGVVLALTAVCCFFCGGGARRNVGAVAAVAGIGLGSLGVGTPLVFFDGREKILEVRESAYHYIAILDGKSQIAPHQLPARLMMFNNLIESGLMLDPATGELPSGPAETACGYTNLLFLGMLMNEEVPKKILIIGCGGGVGPRMFKEYYPGRVERIDVVDIDPWVFKMAEKHFGYPSSGDDVIRSHAVDGRMFVEQAEPGETWDYIIMDAYSSGGRIPKHLVTEEFFALLRSRLAPNGVLVANIISAYEKPANGIDHSRLFRSVHKTLSGVFGVDGDEDAGSLYVFPRNRYGNMAENIIFVAAQPEIPRLGSVDIDRRFQRHRNGLLARIDLAQVVGRQLTVRPDVSDAPVLTDDFCPTDSMVHR